MAQGQILLIAWVYAALLHSGIWSPEIGALNIVELECQPAISLRPRDRIARLGLEKGDTQLVAEYL